MNHKLIVRLLVESFAFAGQALLTNKLRTILSLLGVTIGIFSIIFVLSVVDSMEAEMKEGLNAMGSDILFIQKWPMGPEDGATDYEWWKYMRRREPTLKDMEMLSGRLHSLASCAFQCSGTKLSEYKNNFFNNTVVLGVSYLYRESQQLNIEKGRYFSEWENDHGKNGGIIGHALADQLFGSENPLGKKMKIGGLEVVVIGVLKKEGASIFGSEWDQAIILPALYAERLLDTRTSSNKIIVRAHDGVSSKELKDQVIAVFREVRHIRPNDSNDFSIIESSMLSAIVDGIIGVFNIAGMIIGVFAILVGAFSIANIMFVSVKERTHIIGIQKALGAKNYFILLQFLFESVALCLIGGAFGLFFVWLATFVLSQMSDFHFILPLFRVLMGFAIAGVVGVVSGIVPALSASKLNPVEAIRSK